ncbi:hypothetical protein Droror1_Dr00013837 [Drosera rotundifolia]
MDQNHHQYPSPYPPSSPLPSPPPPPDISQSLLSSLHTKLTTPPRLLSTSAGRPSCSIFKIPDSFIAVNGPKLYYPHIVSIGPVHHGRPHLAMIQEHKYLYLSQLLRRLGHLEPLIILRSILDLESRARESYSVWFDHIGRDEFVEMMVVDGCFVIELFRKATRMVRCEPDDPIVSMQWIFWFLLRDFLRLENQVPFFVLERLFSVTSSDGEKESGVRLTRLCLDFFANAFDGLEGVGEQRPDLQGMHLLDLLRNAFIPLETHQRGLRPNVSSRVIHNVSKLRKAGIKLKQGKSSSWLAIKFHRGVLEMPTVTIDDFMSTFLANCVAYELCHKNSSTYYTTYVIMLDCLINSGTDVEYLADKNIIENYFGTDAEIAQFINNLGKDMPFDVNRCYLAELFNDVNKYYQDTWHIQWASFKYTYFNSPWSFMSALAALVLLILSVLQTLYTMIPFYKNS